MWVGGCGCECGVGWGRRGGVEGEGAGREWGEGVCSGPGMHYSVRFGDRLRVVGCECGASLGVGALSAVCGRGSCLRGTVEKPCLDVLLCQLSTPPLPMPSQGALPFEVTPIRCVRDEFQSASDAGTGARLSVPPPSPSSLRHDSGLPLTPPLTFVWRVGSASPSMCRQVLRRRSPSPAPQ